MDNQDHFAEAEPQAKPQPQTPPPAAGGPQPSGQHKNVGMAIVAYLGLLVLIPLLTDAKNDPFVKFHIKQGLLVLIGLFAASIVMVIPFLGWLVGAVLWVASIVLMALGIMNAADGQEKELPVVGKYASHFHF